MHLQEAAMRRRGRMGWVGAGVDQADAEAQAAKLCGAIVIETFDFLSSPRVRSRS